MDTIHDTDLDQPSPAPAPASRYAELTQLVASMAQDFEKFYTHGNKSAGTRVRQAMQQLKTFAQTVRTEVQVMKNENKA